MKFTTTVQGEGRMAYFEVDDTDMLGDSVWTGLPINRKAMVMSGMGEILAAQYAKVEGLMHRDYDARMNELSVRIREALHGE